MHTSSWSALLLQVFATPASIVNYLAAINWYALGLSLVAPALMLLARQEIRLSRLRAISDFLTSFQFTGMDKTTASTAPRLSDGSHSKESAPPLNDADSREQENPSFEIVKSKYISDLVVKQGSYDEIRLNAAANDFQRINIYIDISSRLFSHIPFRLLLAALGFVILSHYGFTALFAAFGYGSTAKFCDPGKGCGLPVSEAVAAFTFAGAYVAALRMLLRNLAVFDLTAYSFVRQSAEIVASVVIVVLLFTALPNLGFDNTVSTIQNAITAEDTAQPQPTAPSHADRSSNNPASEKFDASTSQPGAPVEEPAVDRISWIWLLLAPALGLLPRSATQFALVKSRSFITWAKTTDDRFIAMTRVTSLDCIDGIDFETRFRLEECGIYDMQNLATYNPIMLFIETPYGIYQCIDWVAQAQLCHIVGMEKFVIFREINIRTIFDLERAIDSIDSPDAYDAICAAILLAPTDVLKKVSKSTGFKFALVDDGVARMEDVDDYFNWIHRQIKSEVLTTEAVEHLMSWISDDLHVRRLRRLWNEIVDSLGEKSEFLKDSKRNPANARKLQAKLEAKSRNP